MIKAQIKLAPDKSSSSTVQVDDSRFSFSHRKQKEKKMILSIYGHLLKNKEGASNITTFDLFLLDHTPKKKY